MTVDEERQEFEFVQRWAKGRPDAEVNARLDEMCERNSYARERLFSPSYGAGVQQGRGDQPVLSNSTGYGYVGSENFEHDNTGDAMNRSGMEDILLNARAESEGWEAGYDFDGAPDVAPE